LRFVLVRHVPVRRELIDEAGQILPQPFQQVVASHPGLLRKRIERVASERAREVAIGDCLVRPGADPRMRHVALAVLLELLEQPAEPAIEHRAGRRAAEHAAEGAAQQIAEIAAVGRSGPGAARTRRRLWRRTWRRRVGALHMFLRVDREQGQHRLRHRRHALAARLVRRRTRRCRTCARIAGGASNAVENVEQAHIDLLTGPNPAAASAAGMTVARQLGCAPRCVPANASVPIPTLAPLRGALVCELQNRPLESSP